MQITNEKNILIVICIGLLITNINAQHWGFEGAEWYYCIPDPAGNNPFYDFEHFWVERDTIVEEKNCILIKSNKDSSLIFHYDDDKVYLHFLDTFSLIYDFGLKRGESVEFSIPASTSKSFILDTLISINSHLATLDSVEIDGIYIKSYRFPLNPGEELDYLVWPSHYEYRSRIGFYWEFFFNLYHPTIEPITYIRCYNDGEIDYVAEWWAEWGEPCDYEYRSQLGINEHNYSGELIIFPTVSSDIFTFRSDNTREYILSITNVMGGGNRLLYVSNNQEFGEDLAPGVYIICIFDENKMNLLYSSRIIKLF